MPARKEVAAITEEASKFVGRISAKRSATKPDAYAPHRAVVKKRPAKSLAKRPAKKVVPKKKAAPKKKASPKKASPKKAASPKKKAASPKRKASPKKKAPAAKKAKKA